MQKAKWSSDPKQDEEGIQKEKKPSVGIQSTYKVRRASSQKGSPRWESLSKIRRVSTCGKGGKECREKRAFM